MLLASAVLARAEQFTEPFEAPTTTWTLTRDAPKQTLLDHTRQRFESHSGQSSELFRFESPGRETAFGLIHSLPVTPVFNELTATVMVKSNRPGCQLAFRIRVPKAIDPKTGRAVVFRLHGDLYTQTGQWQELSCDTSDVKIRRRLQQLRKELIDDGASPNISISQLRVEEIELVTSLAAGTTTILIDDLNFGPLVQLGPSDVVDGTTSVAGPARPRGPSPLDLSGEHIRLHGRPFVPRVAPYHGEPTEMLHDLGFNVVWLSGIDRFEESLTAALQSAKLWITAAPPLGRAIAGMTPDQWVPTHTASHAAASANDAHEIEQTSATSAVIGTETMNVLFWTLGLRVPMGELAHVETASRSVRQSDRLYDTPRPILADVMTGDRQFSRRLDMTGASVPLLHTAHTPADYFLELNRRRAQTLAGQPKLTCIATESSPAVLASRTAAVSDHALDLSTFGQRDPESAEPIVVEPEQILMQAELAYAAGYQGLFFWSRSSLAGDALGDAERRAAVKLINMRTSLLQPWIATGDVVGRFPVTVGDPDTKRPIRVPIVATVLRSDYGQLVRFAWLDDAGQFVPGPMAAANVRVVIRGAGEMPQAYEVTDTSVKSIDAVVKPGGTEITLPRFDQSATVLITSPSLIDDLEKVIVKQRAKAAAAWIDMATAKLERVRRTHDTIQSVSTRPLRHGDSILDDAQLSLERAGDANDAQSHDVARHHAVRALQLLRKLQRDHWDTAVRDLSTPHTSIHTVSFSTLPDYWRQRDRLDHATSESMSVAGGTFDSTNAITAAGWQTRDVQRPVILGQPLPPGRVDIAECDAARGTSLRLAAADVLTNEDRPVSVAPDLVRASIDSPVVIGNPGDLVVLTAQVRAFPGRRPGRLRLSDHTAGPLLGVTGTVPVSDWEPVQLIRPIDAGGRLRFRFDLLGSGSICIDDVTMTVIHRDTPPIANTPVASPPKKPKRNPFARSLEFLPSLPSWKRDNKEAEPISTVTPISSESSEGDRDNVLVLPTIRPGHSSEQ